MKIGFLRIMQPMQGKSKGFVVLAWHRKSWWQWGVWWHPCQQQAKRVWSVGTWRRGMTIALGRFGNLQFQHQY